MNKEQFIDTLKKKIAEHKKEKALEKQKELDAFYSARRKRFLKGRRKY